ncbi:MAG: DUF2927 domain-containing protein [Thermoleophilia bacterium]
MSRLRQLAVVLTVVITAAALTSLLDPTPLHIGAHLARYVQLDEFARIVDQIPATLAAPESLPAYTRAAAGDKSFQHNFMRIVFSDQGGPTSYSGRLTKWDKRQVRIDVLNDGGPGMDAYVRHLARRLNQMQSATHFSVVEGGADITIEFIPHTDYVVSVGEKSVGNCETRFYDGPPGLVSARIRVDAEALPTVDERKPVVIHELTHAIGFKGHLHAPRERSRSVLFYAASRTSWSQNDRAAIRIMYSSNMKNGMSVSATRQALQSIAE